MLLVLNEMRERGWLSCWCGANLEKRAAEKKSDEKSSSPGMMSFFTKLEQVTRIRSLRHQTGGRPSQGVRAIDGKGKQRFGECGKCSLF